MKRWWSAGIGIFSILLIGGAGYFGYQSFGNQSFGNQSFPGEEPAVEETTAPPTIEVDRGDVKKSIIAPGILVNTSETTITSAAAGSIAEIYVREGDAVNQNDVLLRFGDQEQLEANLVEAKLSLTIAQAALQDLSDNLDLARSEAQLAVYAAQTELEQKTTDRERMNYPHCSRDTIDDYFAEYQDALKTFNELSGSNAPRDVLSQIEARRDTAYANYIYCTAPPTDIELAAADVEITRAQAELDIAMAKATALEEGPDPVEAARAQLALLQAERKVAEIQSQLASVELRAPMDGVIISVDAKEGAVVSTGMELLTMVNPGALEAIISVQEEDYPLLSPGQSVELFFEANPDLAITGKVDRIVPKRISTDRALYSVYLSLDEVPGTLVEGMTVDSSIILDSRANAVRLPRAIAHVSSDGTAIVNIWQNGRSVERQIQVGLRGDVYVEVLDGLQPGDLVVNQ